ncbi:unnamed protein product [[Candida] boidinii]|nr:hypothetical protein BVG19_g2900 [[Candida] boidinii]OWB53708.1 hypothetical protein B5S27_g5316 [[Candida] boidinii]GME93885.1 unnamed protein product [[Candida] boidinii]
MVSASMVYIGSLVRPSVCPTLGVRCFTTSLSLKGNNIRNRLEKSVKIGSVIADHEKIVAIKEKKIHKKNMAQVHNESARRILANKLNKDIDSVDKKIDSKTVFSLDEFDKIMRDKNLRLKYKILGTSGNQIKDSLIVDKDVTKFLARDEDHKAVALIRLAKTKGVFASGTLLKYYFSKKLLNKSLEFFNNIKKWGNEPDGRVLNILFSGFANTKDEISNKYLITNQQIEKLFFIFQNLIKKQNIETENSGFNNYNNRYYNRNKKDSDNNRLSLIHVHSMMKAARNAERPDLAIKIFDELLKEEMHLRPDVTTYTEMFNVLKKCTDYNYTVERAEELFLQLQKDSRLKIDDWCVSAYSTIFIFSDDVRLKARCLSILEQWFKVCKLNELHKSEIDHTIINKDLMILNNEKVLADDFNYDLILLPIEDINMKKTKRFEPSESISHRYEYLCNLFKIKDTFSKKPTENTFSKKPTESSSSTSSNKMASSPDLSPSFAERAKNIN